MRIYLFFLILLFIIHFGCKPAGLITEPEIINDYPLEIVWMTPLNPDTIATQSIDPTIIGDFVITSTQQYSPTSSQSKFITVSINTGDILLREDDGSVLICDNINELESTGNFAFEDRLVFNCGADPMSIIVSNLEIAWQHDASVNLGYQISNFKNLIFHASRFEGSFPYDSSYLARASVLDGIFTRIFSVGTSDGFSPNLHPPAVMINSTGDTILYFQNRQWNFEDSGEGGKVDLYCYNMTADSIVWMAEAIDPYGNSSVCLPLYHEGKVYFRGFRTLHCLDAVTGEQMWMHEFVGEFNDLHLGNMLIAEDKLVVKSSDRGIHAFNPESGLLLWERFDTGITSCYMTYYNGSVYFGSYDGELFNVRVSDGKILWAIESPNAGKSPSWEAELWNGVAIDEENNRIITTDGYYLICLQL